MKLAWQPDSITTDVAVMAELSLLWGLDGVVLRAVDGDRQRVPFVNERRVRERLLHREVEIVAVEPGLFEGDLGDRSEWLNEVYSLTPVVEFCVRVGCGVVQASTFSPSDPPSDSSDIAVPFLELVDRARDGIVFAIKNDLESQIARADDLADLVRRLRAKAGGHVVSCSWCPATSLLVGEQPVGCSHDMASLASIIRCRDIARKSQAFASFGSGIVPWDDVFATLVVAGFDGVLSLELPRGTSRSDGLRAATQLITSWRRAAAATER